MGALSDDANGVSCGDPDRECSGLALQSIQQAVEPSSNPLGQVPSSSENSMAGVPEALQGLRPNTGLEHPRADVTPRPEARGEIVTMTVESDGSTGSTSGPGRGVVGRESPLRPGNDQTRFSYGPAGTIGRGSSAQLRSSRSVIVRGRTRSSVFPGLSGRCVALLVPDTRPCLLRGLQRQLRSQITRLQLAD